MSMQISVVAEGGGKANVHIDRHPHVCPHCHKSITANRHEGFKKGNTVELTFRCPDSSCQRIFIGYYNHQLVGQQWLYVYSKTSLGSIKGREFSENIQTISPTFVDIYNQAVTAEAHGLNHVSGIALRKALEFLFKDYLIEKNPEQSEIIQKKALGACINDDVDNPNVREMAKRAVWLGNDETHYVRKWEDKDIRDLKTLIDITLHWLEMEMLTAKYKRDMEGR